MNERRTWHVRHMCEVDLILNASCIHACTIVFLTFYFFRAAKKKQFFFLRFHRMANDDENAMKCFRSFYTFCYHTFTFDDDDGVIFAHFVNRGRISLS